MLTFDGFKNESEDSFAQIAILQSRLIQTAGLIRDPQATEPLRQTLNTMLIQMDSLRKILDSYMQQTQRLLADEGDERRELQRSMKKMARENYKLGMVSES